MAELYTAEQVREIAREAAQMALAQYRPVGGYLRCDTAAELFDYDKRKLQEKCVKGHIPGATKPKGEKEWRIPVKGMEEYLAGGVKKGRKNA